MDHGTERRWITGRNGGGSSDESAVRSAAAADPRAFIERRVDTLVIDEAQLEPALFRAIKASVDADRRPGRFLLTGSSRLLAAPDMADSLVGRVETIDLWPFAERELADAAGPSFADSVFDHPDQLIRSGPLKRAEIGERLLRGGFPEAVRRQPTRRRAWFDNYVRTITQRVIRELADLERLADIPRLLSLCAVRTGTELNTASIASELGIPARTLSAHLAHLATAFLIRLIPAWSTNLSAKVVRRPKLVMTDVGLAAHLQGVTAAGLDRPQTQFGPLLETLVATEVLRQLSWSHNFATLWHFRDRSGAEVDLILEHPDGRIIGIEIKATGTPARKTSPRRPARRPLPLRVSAQYGPRGNPIRSEARHPPPEQAVGPLRIAGPPATTPTWACTAAMRSTTRSVASSVTPCRGTGRVPHRAGQW